MDAVESWQFQNLAVKEIAKVTDSDGDKKPVAH
jgi:hypothetical protein